MAFATKHNGGRSQTNLNFMQIGGEYPFLNCLKTAQEWSYRDNSGSPLPSELDANGYLTSAAVVTNHLGIYTRLFIPTQAARSGNYVVKWDGNGSIFLGQAHAAASGFSDADKTSTTGSGRYKFLPGSDTCDFGINGVGSPYITNVRICHEDDETLLDAGEVFGVRFKQILTQANFGVIRFMNWQQNNQTNMTDSGSMRSSSYVFYEGSEFRPNLYAGSATLSGLKYSVAVPSKKTDGTNWAGLQDKVTVIASIGTGYLPRVVTFTNGSATITSTAHGLAVNDKCYLNLDPNDASSFPTGFNTTTRYYVVSAPSADTLTLSATQGGTAITAGSAASGTLYLSPVMYLNVGSTGDIEIKDSYTNVLSKGGNSYPVANRIATFVYDTSLNAWIKYGGDVALNSKGLINGAPLDVMFRLAAEIGAHPWWNQPPLAADPATDFMTATATYNLNNAPAWMMPRFEGPNELWNNHGGFNQTIYATNKALAYGWTDYNDWYGKTCSVMGQNIAAVYGVLKANVKTQKLYQMILGVRGGAAYNNGVSEANERAESSAYLAQAAAAQSGYIKDRACAWVTHMCTATYWNPSGADGALEDSLITAYSVVATQAEKDALGKVLSDTCNVPGSFFDIPALATNYANWKAWCLARSTPINAMCAYEGCYSPDYYGSSDRIKLRFDSKKNYSLGGYLIAVYNNFTKLSDATFTAEFPSNFIIGDFTSSNGALIPGMTTYVWSIFLGDIYAQTSPQWDAIVRYNAVKRAPPTRMLRMHG
jgi:hypothetical protein